MGSLPQLPITALVQSKIKNDNSFDGVYELQALKEPGAKLIRNMENLQDGECLPFLMGTGSRLALCRARTTVFRGPLSMYQSVGVCIMHSPLLLLCAAGPTQ